MTPAALSGLDLLATAVVLVDAGLAVRYLNPSAENLFEVSSNNVAGQSLSELFSGSAVLVAAAEYARANNCSYTEHDFELGVDGHARLHLSCTVTPVEFPAGDSHGEQLLLGFARVVLQAPPWLIMDDAFGAFDDDTLELVIGVLNRELAHTGVIHIGSAAEAHDRLFTQVVHLVKAPAAAAEGSP